MSKRNSSAWPLRQVVDRYRTCTCDRERLACGHEIGVKQDAFGAYYAARRRCRKCHQGLPPDP